MRILPSVAVLFAVVPACAGCETGGGGSPDALSPDGSAPGQAQGAMGTRCGTCGGTYCMSNQGECDGSSLPLPCIGTAAGAYCSDACEKDGDCAPSMRCLTSCPGHEDAQGICWKASDWSFMTGSVCEDGGGGGSSAPASSCESCTEEECGYEMNKCNASSACVSLAKCVTACSTENCVESCVGKYSSGAQKLIDVLECMDDHCSSACS
jgi:hypothetical protein